MLFCVRTEKFFSLESCGDIVITHESDGNRHTEPDVLELKKLLKVNL